MRGFMRFVRSSRLLMVGAIAFIITLAAALAAFLCDRLGVGVPWLPSGLHAVSALSGLTAGGKPRIALGHGMAVPAPVVARRLGTGHTPVDEPQGQLPGQRRHRTGVRPSQGRVLPRPRIRLVRAVQGRARRLHHPLEHQTTPDTTRWTHPGGILESVHRGLSLYPNKQRPTIGAQFTTGRWPPLFFRMPSGVELEFVERAPVLGHVHAAVAPVNEPIHAGFGAADVEVAQALAVGLLRIEQGLELLGREDEEHGLAPARLRRRGCMRRTGWLSALRGLIECHPDMGLPVSEPRLRLAAINTGWRLPSCPMM